jgi:hypothetical protein
VTTAAGALGVAAFHVVRVHGFSTGHAPAAAAAARVLGDIGDESLLRSAAGQAAPLVQAAAHPDRRLRLAAVEAILNLNPQKAFAGSHHVTDALAYMVATTGHLKALVADANGQEAQRMAGLLVELGYNAEAVYSAKQLASRAVESPDFAFALFNTQLPYSEPDQLVQRIRHDPRSALLPLGLVNVGEDFGRAEALARKHPRTAVFVRTRDVKHMESQVKALMETAGRDFVTREERVQQARRALILLAQITAAERPLYDFKPHEQMLEPTVFVPELSPLAADVLGNLGTPFSQRTLVNVASTNTLPIEPRKAAADAFRRSYDRHGVLLTREEILRQYDRYNGSRFADQPTQAVLGSILDTIESKRKKSSDDAQPKFEKRKDTKAQSDKEE